MLKVQPWVADAYTSRLSLRAMRQAQPHAAISSGVYYCKPCNIWNRRQPYYFLVISLRHYIKEILLYVPLGIEDGCPEGCSIDTQRDRLVSLMYVQNSLRL